MDCCLKIFIENTYVAILYFTVLNRCTTALNSLEKLTLPNHLIINNMLKTTAMEPKAIAPKYASPLKRHMSVDFQFTTKNGTSTTQLNKHLIDSIIASIGLENEVARPKKKIQKNMKDAAVQTMKPFCDVCEIRESTVMKNAETSIDAEHFQSSVHTQVLEQDLMSSRAVFNPSGSVAEGPSMSIAHLTPAQLVSQLAARAKTLKSDQPPGPPPSQYRRNPPYDYDGGRGQHYQNYDNYRY